MPHPQVYLELYSPHYKKFSPDFITSKWSRVQFSAGWICLLVMLAVGFCYVPCSLINVTLAGWRTGGGCDGWRLILAFMRSRARSARKRTMLALQKILSDAIIHINTDALTDWCHTVYFCDWLCPTKCSWCIIQRKIKTHHNILLLSSSFFVLIPKEQIFRS